MKVLQCSSVGCLVFWRPGDWRRAGEFLVSWMERWPFLGTSGDGFGRAFLGIILQFSRSFLVVF